MISWFHPFNAIIFENFAFIVDFYENDPAKYFAKRFVYKFYSVVFYGQFKIEIFTEDKMIISTLLLCEIDFA